MMLRIAFQDCEAGVPIHYCTDGDVFDLRRLQAKVQLAVLRDLLSADDSALVAYMPAELQILFERFFNAAKRFGLTVSLKKSEAMCQSHPPSQTASVRITAGDDTVLKSVDKFCYLSSFLSNTGTVTSHLIWPRQAVHLVNSRRGCGTRTTSQGKEGCRVSGHSDNYTNYTAVCL